MSYPDAHRYRLGANYEHLPVNACPFGFSNYQRDGRMALGDNGGPGPNYFPNSFDGPIEDKTVAEPIQELDGFAARYDRNEGPGNDDHYTQAGNLFRLLDAQDQRNLIDNVVGAMSGIEGPKKTSSFSASCATGSAPISVWAWPLPKASEWMSKCPPSIAQPWRNPPAEPLFGGKGATAQAQPYSIK
ncbi:catalase [Hymenobacter terrenus]|uniref:catalase n=1 Tax=Hymenobacter terrenus TaxID=1629124 RepID=UPI0006193748|nr:catalase [Hymenobacter terrenus]